MTPSDFESQLLRHEGLRLKPYYCTADKLTIGIGRNLDDVGITEDEALYLMKNDVERVSVELIQAFPSVISLDSVRYYVLVNMCFNLGISRLKKFKRMWTAVRRGEWSRAADEMLDSLWADQVGRRAIELSDMMRSGKFVSE